MRRLAIIGVIGILLGLDLVVSPITTRAQSGWDWIVTYNFRTSDWGLTPATGGTGPQGEWIAGQGWTSTTDTTGGVVLRRIVVATKTGFFSTGMHLVRIDVNATVHKTGYTANDCGDTFGLVAVSDTAGAYLYNACSVPEMTEQNNTIWTGDETGQTYLGVGCQSYRRNNDDPPSPDLTGNYCTIHSITFYGVGTPPEEGDFGQTPSDTLQPVASCSLLGLNNSSFKDPNDWIFFAGAGYVDEDSATGLKLPPGGYASKVQTLDPGKPYSMEFRYQTIDGATGSIIIKIHGQPFTIPLISDDAIHAYYLQPAIFSGSGDEIEITAPLLNEGDVAITFLCLSPSATDQAVIPDNGGAVDGCEVCDPPYALTDIIGILNWLVCNIRRVFTCYVIPTLVNFLTFLITGVKYFLSFIQWILDTVGGAISWVGGIISTAWDNVVGYTRNQITSGVNSFQQSGLADDTNIMASGIRDLPTALNNAFTGLAGMASDAFSQATSLIDLIPRLIGLAAAAIFQVLSMIPLAIQALIDGINSASVPVSGSLVCSDSNSLLYYPCLGFYILDNTLFKGPAGYLIPILIGCVVFDAITWSFTRIKEELTK